MVNKKGWIRIVEASIAVVIILSVLFVVYNNQRQSINLVDEIAPLLDEIAQNVSFREKIINYDTTKDENYGSNKILLDELNSFLSNRLNLNYINFTVKVCDPESVCGLEKYPEDASDDLFVDERIISSTLSEYNPKKIKVFLWVSENTIRKSKTSNDNPVSPDNDLPVGEDTPSEDIPITPGFDVSKTISIGILNRAYKVHLPSGYDSNKDYPLVFVLHGGGGNIENAEKMSNMSILADKEGFIVVYPQGIFTTWNGWTCCGYAVEKNINDIRFFDEMIIKIKEEYSIDNNKIYASGFSNGGFMAYRLACEMSEDFAAVGVVAGSLTGTCNPSKKVSVIIFHGLDDENVPYLGGKGSKSLDNRPADKPVSYAVDFWKVFNGCSNKNQNVFGNISYESYNCQQGIGLDVYSIDNQGHAWPGGTPGLEYGNIDLPTKEISATEKIWQFFEAHPKK